MDGDDKGSGGTAVCDGGPGEGAEGEAEASGDVAPTPADGKPAAPDGAEDVTPVDVFAEPAEPDDSVPDDAVPDAPDPDDSTPDQAVSDTSVPDDASDQPETVAAAAATDGTASVAPAQRLRSYLRRGVVALVAAGFVALGVVSFTRMSPSPEAADRRFVEAAQSEGHVVALEQQPLIVSAARKICERRVIHDSDRERRATALTSDEIAAVGTAFGADTRDFTTLALKTYCSS